MPEEVIEATLLGTKQAIIHCILRQGPSLLWTSVLSSVPTKLFWYFSELRMKLWVPPLHLDVPRCDLNCKLLEGGGSFNPPHPYTSGPNVFLKSPFIKFCWVEINLPKPLNMLFGGLSWTAEHWLSWTAEHWAPERFWPINPIPLQAVSEHPESTAPRQAPSPFLSDCSWILWGSQRSSKAPAAAHSQQHLGGEATFSVEFTDGPCSGFRTTQPHGQNQKPLPGVMSPPETRCPCPPSTAPGT